MSKLLILGAGGHGKVVADAAMASGKWSDIAFLDNNNDLNEVLGFPVLGRFESYQYHLQENWTVFVAIGNNSARMYWLDKLELEGYNIATIIHPYSTISGFSSLGKGSVALAGVVVNANSSIGRGCIVNTSSTVDHDCIISEGVHISPGVNISGTVTVKEDSWLGVGAKVNNNITIGKNVIVAAGAVIIKDVPDNVMVAGIPSTIKKYFGDEQ
ncbi:acetyltransferase [Paenibacillus sp. FSL L8-0340]|uniref:acetyltransferase n=1 Tax=Paenibacillus sp. FSL L8-0340 TaxID=2954685 RepID=UPI0031590594